MLSIIIPTYNEEEHIERLLLNLKPQLTGDDEIVVVDSHSQDRTVEIAKKHGARVVLEPKQGIGLAKTAGAKAAKNEVVVFLDADCIVADDFASRLRGHFSAPHIIAAGGIDLYSSDSSLHKFTYDTYSKIVFYFARAMHLTTGKYWFAANNAAFRKKPFLDVGGYRSVICEDTDLTRRLPPSRDIIYDSRLWVELSDRRFKSEGFLRTLGLWGKSNIAAWTGRGAESSRYKTDQY